MTGRGGLRDIAASTGLGFAGPPTERTSPLDAEPFTNLAEPFANLAEPLTNLVILSADAFYRGEGPAFGFAQARGKTNAG